MERIFFAILLAIVLQCSSARLFQKKPVLKDDDDCGQSCKWNEDCKGKCSECYFNKCNQNCSPPAFCPSRSDHMSSNELQYAAVGDCPNDCNHHGDCKFIDGIYKCVCDDDWGGLSCDHVNYDLPSDHAVSVTLKKGDLNYFTIKTRNPPDKNLTFIVLGFSKNSSAIGPSIYVAHGYYPTMNSSQYSDNSTSLKKNVTILNPELGTWFLAVYGEDVNPLILTVQANMDDECFSNCSNHGDCHTLSNNYVNCSCQTDFSGEYCEHYDPIMKNATKYRGYITPELWNYWYYNITYHEIPDGSYLVFSTAATKEGANPPDIYILFTFTPTLENYFCHMPERYTSTNQFKPNHQQGKKQLVNSCIMNDHAYLKYMTQWNIGVYGTPDGFGDYTVSVELHIKGPPLKKLSHD